MPDLTAADVRKILNEKFPATNPREKVYVSVTLALLDQQEVLEAQVRGLADLFGGLCMALEVDPRQLLALKTQAQQTTVEGDEGGSSAGSSGTAGMGGSGAGMGGGGVGGGAVGGGGAGPVNPIADKTPFPAGTPTSAPPGTRPAPKVTSNVKPAPAPVEEEDLTPNVQSGPAVNARPNVAPPVNGAPKVQ